MTWELREEARRREEERAELARKRELFASDLRTLSAMPEGRRFFRWLIGQGDIFAEDYQPGPMGAYRAGVKAMSIRLWRLLEEQLPADAFVAIVLDSGRKGTAASKEEAREDARRRDDTFRHEFERGETYE